MFTVILLRTDSLTLTDFANCIQAANKVLAKWAPKWGIDAVVTADPAAKFDMAANVTDRNRHTSALGYHTVEAGVPTAYISPSALLHNVYGTYTPAHWTAALWNLLRTKITRAAKQTSPARYREGICSVLIHELMEMLADAHIDRLSKPDSLGLNWLVEVADHVSGSYFIEVVNGINCVIPDATFPSYYDLNGKAPFSLNNSVTTPFATTTPTFYGYTKDVKGALLSIVKGSVHHLPRLQGVQLVPVVPQA